MIDTPDHSRAPRPAFVIHVGPPKTGTTWIQTNLFATRQRLAADGWLYPVICDAVPKAHHEVAALLKGGGIDDKPVLDRLVAAAGRARKAGQGLLLSSEAFHRSEPAGFVALARHLGHDRLGVIHVLRDPLEQLASAWSEHVKNGHGEPFARFVGRTLAAPERSDILNPARRLDALAARPEIDLVILDSRALKEDGIDLFSGFVRHGLGLEGYDPAPGAGQNPRMPDDLLELIRRLAPAGRSAKATFGRMHGRVVERRLPARLRDPALAAIRARTDARAVLEVDPVATGVTALAQAIGERHGPRIRPRLAPGPGSITQFEHLDATVLDADPEVSARVARAAEWLSGQETNRLRLMLRQLLRPIRRLVARLTRR